MTETEGSCHAGTACASYRSIPEGGRGQILDAIWVFLSGLRGMKTVGRKLFFSNVRVKFGAVMGRKRYCGYGAIPGYFEGQQRNQVSDSTFSLPLGIKTPPRKI